MSEEEIYLSGKKLISLQRAHEATGYAKDYIGQLCRLGKIKAERIGRDWFVNLADLNEHKKLQKEKRSESFKKSLKQNKDISLSRDIAKEIEKEINSLDAFSNDIFSQKTLAIKYVSGGLAFIVLSFFIFFGSNHAEASFYKWAKEATDGLVGKTIFSLHSNLKKSLDFSSDLIINSPVKTLSRASNIGENFFEQISSVGNDVALVSDGLIEDLFRETNFQLNGLLSFVEDSTEVANLTKKGVMGFADEYSASFLEGPLFLTDKTQQGIGSIEKVFSQNILDNPLDILSLFKDGAISFADQYASSFIGSPVNFISNAHHAGREINSKIVSLPEKMLTVGDFITKNYLEGVLLSGDLVYQSSIEATALTSRTGKNIYGLADLIRSSTEDYPFELLAFSAKVSELYEKIIYSSGEGLFALSSQIVESPRNFASFYKNNVIGLASKIANTLPYIVSDIWEKTGEYVFDNLYPIGEKLTENSIVVGNQISAVGSGAFGGVFEKAKIFLNNVGDGYREFSENVDYAINGIYIPEGSTEFLLTSGSRKDTDIDENKKETVKIISSGSSLEDEVRFLRQEVEALKRRGFSLGGSVSNSSGANVVERTIERVVGGLTGADLDARLEDINNRLMSQIASVRSFASAGHSSNFQAIALTQKIDQLKDTTISTPTISSPTITGAISADTFTFSSGSLSSTLSVSGTTSLGVLSLTDNILLANQKGLRLYESSSNGTNYIEIKATSSIASNFSVSLPNADGTSGQALLTNGAGTWYWGTSGVGSVGTASLAGQVPYYASASDAITATSSIFVATNQYVGIGTTSPYALFSVNAPTGIPSFVIGSSTATNFIVDQNNRVGVSTTTPSARFAVTGSGTGTGRLFSFADSANTERLTLLDNGSLGVGTTSPTNLFSVAGSIFVGASATSTFTSGLQTTVLNITSTSATSTFANGIQISSGCYRLSDGSCAGSGISVGAALSGATEGSVLFAGASGVLAQDNSNFYWDDTNNRFGLSSSTPTAKLTISAESGDTENLLVVASSTENYFSISSTGTTTISNLNTGALSFDTNAGAVTWVNLPVTSDAAINTVERYSANIDDISLLTLYGQSNGAGGILGNYKVGIASSTPWATLSVEQGTSTDPVFVVADQGTSTPHLLVNSRGYVGIGTTSPYALFSVNAPTGIPSFVIGSSTATNFIVDQNNRIGVSTTTPGALFSVGGAGLFQSTTTASAFFSTNSNSSSILSGGLGVGGTTTPSARFAVTGSGTGTGRLFSFADSANTERLTLLDNGSLGVGTTSPGALFSVGGNSLFGTGSGSILTYNAGTFIYPTSATSTILNNAQYAWTLATSTTATPIISFDTRTSGSGKATTTITGGLIVDGGAINYDYGSGVTSIDNLQLGSLNFDSNAGIISWVDMPITSSASINTVETYSAQLDGNAVLTVWGQSNGAGGVLNNYSVGIASSTPWGRFSVEQGTSSQPVFVVADQGTSTPHLLVDPRGYVGVGTSSPTNLFSVAGSIFVGASATSTFTSGLQTTVLNITSTSATSTFANGITLSGGCLLVGGSCLGSPSIGGTLTSATAGSVLFAGSGTFAQDNSNFYWDDTNNRFGLSSSTPTAKLTISAESGDTENLLVVASSTENYFSISSTGTTTISNLNTGALSFDTNAGFVTAFDLPVTSSAAAGTIEAYAFMSDASTTAVVYAESDGAGGVQNQRFGVGTTTPTEMLSVAGRLFVGGSGTSTIQNNLYVIGTMRATVSYAGDLIFANNFRFTEAPASSTLQALWLQNQYGSTTLAVNELGNIGIGTTTPEYKLHVMGDVAATGFVNISTETAKKDVAFLNENAYENALRVIKESDLATYNYKTDTCKSSESVAPNLRTDSTCAKRFGLIAEQAPIEVLSDDRRGVDIYKMTSLVYAAVKAQQNKIDQIETRLSDIERRVLSGEFSGKSSSSGSGINLNSLFGNVLSSIKSLTGQFVEVIADKVSTKKVVTDGLEMKDSVTGDYYCVRISEGEWTKFKGTCGDVPASLSADSSSESASNENQSSSSIENTEETTQSNEDTATTPPVTETETETSESTNESTTESSTESIVEETPSSTSETETPPVTETEIETNESTTESSTESIVEETPSSTSETETPAVPVTE